MKTNDGKLYVIGGKSRTGKSAIVSKMIAKVRRVMVWDVEDQFAQLPGFRRVTSLGELLELVQKPGRMKLAFIPGGSLKAHFDTFCQIAFYAARFAPETLDLVTEELADVTSPGKAPGAWGMLIRRALKRGMNIYCISQRWQEADKTAFGNASEFIVFQQARTSDAKYMATETDIPLQDILDLQPLQYIKKDTHTKKITHGKLRF